MKSEMTATGWREVTTENIVVEKLGTKPLMLVTQWIDFNERHPGIGRKRQTCKCCRKNWEGLSGNVHIAFTNKGNKSICDGCFNELSEKIKYTIPVGNQVPLNNSMSWPVRRSATHSARTIANGNGQGN